MEVGWDVVVDGTVSTGDGVANELTDRAGWFWFFDDENAEVAVKVLDGVPVNGHHWVFYASLSNVGFDLAVTDTATGAFQVYRNPRGRLASRGDTGAFDADTVPAGRSAVPAGPVATAATAATGPFPASLFAPLTPATGCSPGPGVLCLQEGRFRVTATWEDFEGGSGEATGVPISDDSGYLWFFAPENLELFVKVLDGRGVNGHWWVFYGSLSNVPFEVTVTDTVQQVSQTYANPSGVFASVADTTAF